MNDSVSTIGHRMRAARTQRALTLREVAYMVQATESQVSRWENGHTIPAATVLEKYEAAGLLQITDPEAAA